jgi:diaminopimelate decarboxylase
VLNVLARLGSGFDIVSGGELERVLAAGRRSRPRWCFPAWASRRRKSRGAGMPVLPVSMSNPMPNWTASAPSPPASARPRPISLRVNPDVDAGTHPYISTGLKENKFGIAIERALDVYLRAAACPG